MLSLEVLHGIFQMKFSPNGIYTINLKSVASSNIERFIKK